MSVIVLDPGDSANISIQWQNLGVGSVSSVSYAPITGLTITPQSVINNVSTVRLSGLKNGATYQLEASATLNTGEVLNRNIPIRGFNG
jgi:hypothetical protein